MTTSEPTPPPALPPTPDRPGEGRDDVGGEFGPSGYLPARAAQRARKIVLREQMGLQWPVAAVVAGVLILAVMIPLVRSATAAPGAPFVDLGPISQVDAGGDAVLAADPTTSVLVIRGGGVLTAFVDAPAAARFCAASRRIEDGAGRVWSLQGRLLAGEGPSLLRAPTVAYDDRLFIDLDPTEPPLAPAPGSVAPGCGA